MQEPYIHRVSNNRTSHLVNICVRAIFLVVLLAFIPISTKGQNCEPTVPTYVVDLTSDVNATWTSTTNFQPIGQCCDAPEGDNCFEFIIYLHPDATSVTFEILQGPTGGLYYQVDCSPAIEFPNNPKKICLLGNGPHHITFCRSGTPPPFLVDIISQDVLNVDVTLNPFSDVCIDAPSFVLTGGSPLGGTYLVNGVPATSFNPATIGVGTHTIRYIYNHPSGCSGFADQEITVFPLPEVTYTPQTACLGSGDFNLSGGSPAGGIYSGLYVLNGVFQASAAGPGAHEVVYTYTDANGCTSSASGYITIYPNPIADAGADKIIASGTSTALNAASGGTGTYSYQWAPVALVLNPNSPSTSTVNLTSSTVFTLTVTDLTTGCVSTDEVVVTITGGSLSIVQIVPEPPTVCAGEEVSLWVLASGGTGTYTYSWTSNPAGFTSLLQNPSANPTVTTTYTVVVSDGALSATASVTVTVLPLPVVTLPSQGSVCANTQGFSFSGGSPAGGYYFASGHTFNEGQTFSPYILGEGLINVYYYYTNASGCVGEAQNTVQVLPYVKASFDMSSDLCEPTKVKFINKSFGGTQFEWYFGDGASSTTTDLQFEHNYPITGSNQTYTITLIARNASGCFNVYTNQITIGPSIHSEFTASTISGCAPLEVDFTHMMTGPIALFLWNFGDYNFSVQPNPTHTFENFGTNDTTYTVSLSVISSNFFCVETYELDILVHPYIKAGVSVVPNQSCNPYPATLGNTSIGNDSSIWDFGDGQSSTLNTPTVDHLFENYTSAAVTYNVHLTVANEEGCQDTISYPITVFPHVEADFSPSGIEGCAPYEVNFTDASIGVHLYHWDFGDGAISYDANPVHTFNNQTNATIVYPVKLKVFNQEQCVDSLIIDITVKPEVKAGFVFNPANACNPYDVEIINTSTGASSYAWDFGDGTTGTNADPSFTHYYEHNNPTPLTYLVSLEVENPQGCKSNLIRELIVYPKVNADFSANEIRGCNPLEVQFSNLSIGANTYYWDFGDGGSATDVSPQHTFVNTSYLVPDTFSVVLKSVSQWLCESYDTLNIVVYPAISPEFNVDEPSGCSPHAVVFTQSAQGGLSYTWDYGDGDTYTGTDLSVNHTYVNSGSEPVSYTAIFDVTNSFSCSVQSQKEIIVYPEVHAVFSHTTEGCHPLEASFTNNSQNAHTYLWEFGDGYSNMVDNPTHTYYNFSHTNSIEMFVSLYAESSYGCSDTEYSSIEVFPKPDASFIITNSPGCSPYEIIIVNMSEGALTHSWDFDDGVTSSEGQGIISHLYNHEPGTGPAIFDIGLIVDNSFGCYDTLTQQAIIYPNIVSDFQPDIIEGCHPLTVSFLNESTGATANTPYHWNYGDGLSGTSQDLTHTHIFNNFDPVQTAVFEVSLISENENGCKDTSWVTINVFPRPQPSYNVLNSPGCSPHTVEFENTTAGGQDFLWTFGDGATSNDASTNINHLYTVPAGPDAGIFNVSLWTQNQFLCDATFTQQVTIYPDISAQIDVVSEGCHPFATEFTNLGAGGNTYLWDFGDGNQSVAVQPQNTYFNYDLTNPAQFTVVLEATSAFQCVAYDTVTITVNPKPEASFHMESTSGCAPFQTQITNLSTGGTAHFWDFGNGAAQIEEPAFTHLWLNNGGSLVGYEIQLIAENDFMCSDTSSISILVYPQVYADFTTSDGLFEGCSPYEVNFVNQTYLGNTYTWSFGDGETSDASNPYHVFENNNIDNQVFQVEMIATSIFTCTDTIQKDITVFPSPIANFIPTPEWQVYPSATVTLVNTTNDGNWDFHWDYGDGDVFDTQSFDTHDHTYTWPQSDLTTKTYLITLSVSNENCSSTTNRLITITSPHPEAIFEPTDQGCQPFTVQFVNNSLHANSYDWDFKDGSVSYAENPSHTFYDHGEYQVELVAHGDGGMDTTFRTITVHELPRAQFIVDPNLIEIPYETLNVINQSYNSSYYWWFFGDGNTSTEFEPDYLYYYPGIYDITLIVATNTEPQCYDTLVFNHAVKVNESCRLIFPNAFIPSTSGPSGGHYNINDKNNQIFYPLAEGVERYRLEIYTRWGELIFVSEDINIGWDGYYKGKLAKQDVYVFKATGMCTSGREFSQTGDVTLYR